MISLTRREFDSVSAALTDAVQEARREARLVPLPPRKAKPQSDLRALESATQH